MSCPTGNGKTSQAQSYKKKDATQPDRNTKGNTTCNKEQNKKQTQSKTKENVSTQNESQIMMGSAQTGET